MENKDFIEALVEDAKPVKPILSVLPRFLLWLCLSLGVSISGIIYFKIRHNMTQQLQSSDFWIETGLILVSLVATGLLSLRLSQTNYPQRKKYWIWLIPSAIWVFKLCARLYNEFQSLHHLPSLDMGYQCSFIVSIVGLLPALLLVYLVKRATPERLLLLGASLFIAGFSIGELSLQFVCPSESALHVLVWHIGPLILFAIAGILISRKLLRW